jgi:hypothetical protein
MPWIGRLLAGTYRLFVDDGHFALAIVVWLAVVWGALRLVPGFAGWGGIVFFAGLAAILLESVGRRADAAKERQRASPPDVDSKTAREHQAGGEPI